MKYIKKGLLTIVTILLVLVLTYNIYNFISINVLHKDLATVNGYAVLEVVSGSMEPTIHVGDLIIIDTKVKNFNEQDIITFYDKQGSFVTHRIMSIEGDEMITQGDNNDTEDDLTPMSKIVGKYVTRINGGGKLLAAFKSPLTMVMILIIGVLVCVLISTDEDGNPILDEEEKEFKEFQEYKNNLNKKETKKEENKTDNKVAEDKKKTTKKPETKKNATKTTKTKIETKATKVEKTKTKTENKTKNEKVKKEEKMVKEKKEVTNSKPVSATKKKTSTTKKSSPATKKKTQSTATKAKSKSNNIKKK